MSQNAQILNHLKREPLTALEALNLFGCMRLASRINELRYDGHTINTEWVHRNGKKFAQYHLLNKKPLE